MEKELSLLMAQMREHGECTERDFGIFMGYIGEIAGNEVLAFHCGIGKVNAALRTMRMIDEYHPDVMVNSGVAGGVDPSMKIGSVLVAENVAYHDVWCGEGTEIGAADGCPRYLAADSGMLAKMRDISAGSDEPLRFGLLCSGDMFISKPEEVAEIKRKFPEALGCDMESGAMAQTCRICNVPFIVVRVLSDMPGGGENISEYRDFWGNAPKRTFDAVLKLIKAL